MSDNCLFCKIVKGVMPANIVDQNEHVLAFRDINPQAPTHVLFIPKEHITSSRDLNEENVHYLTDMIFLAQKVALEECANSHTLSRIRLRARPDPKS